MKKMIVFVLMLVMAGYTTSFAGPSDETSLVVMKRGDVYQVAYSGHCSAPVQVSIHDKRGVEIFSERLDATNGFIRPYNLSKLPQGDYSICVRDDSGIRVKKICTRIKELPAYISKLDAAKNKFMISIPNQPNGDLTISIYDNQDRLLYSARENVTRGFAQVYVLKNVTDGVYFRLVNNITGEEKYHASAVTR